MNRPSSGQQRRRFVFDLYFSTAKHNAADEAPQERPQPRHARPLGEQQSQLVGDLVQIDAVQPDRGRLFRVHVGDLGFQRLDLGIVRAKPNGEIAQVRGVAAHRFQHLVDLPVSLLQRLHLLQQRLAFGALVALPFAAAVNHCLGGFGHRLPVQEAAEDRIHHEGIERFSWPSTGVALPVPLAAAAAVVAVPPAVSLRGFDGQGTGALGALQQPGKDARAQRRAAALGIL